MPKISGGCHCANIALEMELPAAPETYRPRVCDCDFCRMHGAAYLSDANGSLRISIKNASARGSYRQGSGQAEFLLCTKCGVLVGVLFQSGGHTYAGINVRAVDSSAKFGEDMPVSPQTLSPDAKAKRWRSVWFSNVDIA